MSVYSDPNVTEEESRMLSGSGKDRTVSRVRALAVGFWAAGLLLAVMASGAHGSSLPDGRGYELVSPPLKNGGEVMPDSQRARASADGSAVGFAALSGFGDVLSMGVSMDYMAVRTALPGTNGWAMHALTPPQSGVPYVADTHFMEPAYWGEFSDDLSHGVFRSFSPVTAAPMVANEQNWYLRDDLRSPGIGSYRLLTDCPGCSTPFPPVSDPLLLDEQSFIAGESQDFEHVIFESRLPLTADSTADAGTGNLNLFEWDHGTVRLAGVLPNGACGSPPCAAPQSQAGQGATNALYTPHVISADGSRIFFTVLAPGCAGGVQNCGDLYLRSAHAETIKVNVSEKTDGSGPGGTDSGGPQPAVYWDASTDGARAFFTSAEALTDDAPADGESKLYMYSVQADGLGHHLTLVSVDQQPNDDASTSDDVVGVVGASSDGHTVYFVNGGGQLAAGQPSVTPGVPNKMFRWHDGTIEYVGGTGVADQLQNLNANYVPTPKQARITPDGTSMLFSAAKGSALTGYNHGSCPNNGTASGTCRELYLYRADTTPHLVCVSCNPSGARATADAMDVVHTGTGGAVVTYHLNHAISDDGRRVFFNSGEALVPEDTNRAIDAYEYDVPTGRLHLLSTGTDPSNSYFMDASRNGDDVFILTRQRLVGWDIDGGYDLYDVRVGGGVPDPVARVVCGVATCRGPVHAAPAGATTVTEGLVGSNVKPMGTRRPRARACRRGLVRKRVHGRTRCVKKPKPRKHAAHRRSR